MSFSFSSSVRPRNFGNGILNSAGNSGESTFKVEYGFVGDAGDHDVESKGEGDRDRCASVRLMGEYRGGE